MRACCRYTRRRPDRTHGGVLNVHTGSFSACQASPHTTPHHTTGTEDTTSGDAAGCSERAPAAAGFRARGVPVLLSAVAGHAVSGGCDGRRGGLRLRPFPRGFCVGGQMEGGEGGAGEEHRGEGAVARCAACSPDAGAEAQDRRDLRRVSGLSLLPAGEEEEEEEEEEKASSVYSSSTRLSTSL